MSGGVLTHDARCDNHRYTTEIRHESLISVKNQWDEGELRQHTKFHSRDIYGREAVSTAPETIVTLGVLTQQRHTTLLPAAPARNKALDSITTRLASYASIWSVHPSTKRHFVPDECNQKRLE